jgi:ABC-type Fe3+ transport system permease subunit
MERPERVPQLYGYSVCLVAIVVMLVSVGTIVNKSFTLANPLVSNGPFGWGGPAMTSFAAYRATADQSFVPMPPGSEAAARPKPTEEELRARFEALRADQIARNRFDAQREITGSAILLLFSAALFWWHWRWVRGAEARALVSRAVVRDALRE